MQRAHRIPRREALAGAAGLALAAALPAPAHAAESPPPMPVAFVSHGAPLLAIDPVRGPALRAWGARLPRPRGVVAMTPHWGSRRLLLGATGRGVAQYDFPRWLAGKLPPNLTYASPPSEALAVRVEDLLEGGGPGPGACSHRVERGGREGLDHTTWMPLLHMLPTADAPVLEMALPYIGEAALFALGRRLAPLRDEGVLFLASGGFVHNLAAIDLGAPGAPPPRPPAWSSEFDAWGAERLAARDVDALLDWRRRAPAAELAHPDDGGHFRVLLVALGVALGGGSSASAGAVTFPFAGYEAAQSVRCVQLA